MGETSEGRISYGAQWWRVLEGEVSKRNAFLLPLRLFIGLGWLRAGVEKLMDPLWRSGESLLGFFQMQMSSGAIYFPFYETLITQLFAPHAFALALTVQNDADALDLTDSNKGRTHAHHRHGAEERERRTGGRR